MEDEYIIDMIFAEDIMKFLISESGKSRHMRWKPELTLSNFADGHMKLNQWYEELGFPQYDKIVGLAVWNIVRMNENRILEIYDEFVEMLVLDGTDFATLALNASPMFFPEGYNSGGFLGYCATVMGVALCFFNLPPSDIPRAACGIVAQVLFSHQMTYQFDRKGEWIGLYCLSLAFNECVDTDDMQT